MIGDPPHGRAGAEDSDRDRLASALATDFLFGQVRSGVEIPTTPRRAAKPRWGGGMIGGLRLVELDLKAEKQ
jgi:hypothetical protein